LAAEEAMASRTRARSTIIITIAAASATLVARAQEPKRYSLALVWKARAGDRVRIVESLRSERALDVVESNAPVRRTSTADALALDLVRSVLALDAQGRVAKETRAFSGFSSKHDDREDRSLAGKTLSLDRSGERAVASIENDDKKEALGPLARELIEEWKLDRRPDLEALVTPRRDVAEGESWDLDPIAIVRTFGDPAVDRGELVKDGSSAHATLAKVVEKDGSLEGKIEVSANARVGTERPAEVSSAGEDRLVLWIAGSLDGKTPERVLHVEETFARETTKGERSERSAKLEARFTRDVARSAAPAK
jgi:hypothetical protein